MHILLADDHDLVREGLALLFKNYFEDCVVTEAGDLDGAFRALDAMETPPSLILLDLRMPGMDGFDGLTRTIDRVAGAEKPVPVVLLSGAISGENVRQSIEKGAQGFIPKTLRGEALANAIRLVLSGEKYLPSMILAGVGDTPEIEQDYPMPPVAAPQVAQPVEVTAETLGNNEEFSKLTPREREVLALLAEGRPNKDIARVLELREITIKYHLKNIYRKLEVSNRGQALKKALEGARAG